MGKPTKENTIVLVKNFLLDNKIVYLDKYGWNEIVYDDLDDTEHAHTLYLTTIYNYLYNYVAKPIIRYIEEISGRGVEYVSHFGVDRHTEDLFICIQMSDNSRKYITII